MFKENDIITGVLHFNASGSAFLRSDDFEGELYVYKHRTGKALHLDTVEVTVIKGKVSEFEGEVLNVVKRFRDEFVGTIQINKEHAFLIPDSNKMVVDIYIPKTKLNMALDGQKAVAKLLSWEGDKKSPRGEIIEVLGDANDNNAERHAILHEFDLPYNFSKEVIAESEEISNVITDEEIEKRRDMREVLTFTIDPDTAKDFDDALSVEWVDGKIQVGVHIADVTHYLQEGTVLDKEAFDRGTSVYLVDRCVPMLPERLSNGLCSLVPNEDRLCYSVIFTLDNRGVITDEWFGRTIIHSKARFTYEEAQQIIEADTNEQMFDIMNALATPCTGDESVSMQIAQFVKDLNRYAKKIRERRMRGKSVSFDKKEISFVLDDNAKPVGLKMKEMKDSNKLIEEFMLLANKRVATFLNTLKLPMVQRSHDAPSKDKLIQLNTFIEQFGYKINITDPHILTDELNRILLEVKGTPEENIITSLVTRTMTKAFYSTKNIGHFGLGFEHYSHFTSPIRRYPDVMAHRLLTNLLQSLPRVDVNKIEGMCVHLSERERKSQKAQRASIKYKQVEYLSERIGKVYTGVISSIMEFGIFVEMEENACEGLVRLADIGNTEPYVADTANHCVKGYASGTKLRLGDEVTVIIKGVDMVKKEINLTLLTL